MKMGSKTGRFATGLIIGSLAGGAAGRETRESVRHQTGHYVGTLRKRFQRNGSASGLRDGTVARVEVLN